MTVLLDIDSACAWTYDARAAKDNGDEACVVATHLPTGLQETFADLVAAHCWTSRRRTVTADLAAAARATLAHPYAIPTEKARATRALMVLAGTLLPATVEVQARCRCGGYLTYLTAGLVHVDTCVEEIATPGVACPDDRNTHRVCDSPSPAVCDHDGCSHPTDILAIAACPSGQDHCCGTRHGGES